MLSKAQIQFVKSLHQKKFRDERQKFIVEGPVLVQEALNSDFTVETIYSNNRGLELLNKQSQQQEIIEVSNSELVRISQLKQPHDMLAVVQMKVAEPVTVNTESLGLALDQLSDPGNMGTIIRIADWFGIKEIICSEDCVEIYNPKVVQATMGSLFRVKFHYTSLNEFILNSKKKNSDFNVYGTVLNGKNIYSEKLEQKGVILIGNESRGISAELQKLIDVPLTIPSFNSSDHAESLNVAVATAIVCNEFRRRS